jgi:hypothetical protein
MREKTKEVWSEALNLVQQWEKLTREIGESVSRNKMEKLVSLLNERQQLSDRLDALRAAHNITSWTNGAAPGDPLVLAVIKDEAALIFQHLQIEDQRILQEMHAKMNSLKQEINHLHQTKAAHHAYQGPQCPPPSGSFIDTKK